MRKPLIALGLALSTSLGAVPVADTLAATPVSSLPHTTQNTSTSASSQAPRSAVSGAAIVQTAMQYLGYPYTATGNSPSTGFSCIGFVSFVYRSNGIALPGDLGGALAYAPQVPFSSLQPGDILYFQNTVWNGLSHAAIYIGGGKFIHAEWYNRGVVISSFNHDPVDGDYWIHKYLGANRPWSGASVAPVVVPGTSTTKAPATTAPKTTVVSGTANGPSAVVKTSLNVRSAPAKSSSVVTVLPQGSTIVVIGHSQGWDKVQLPDGSVGWVMSRYISDGSQTPVTTSVGTPASPRQVRTPTKVRTHAVAAARVSGLRVHSSPSTGAPVVTTVARGQRMQVVARSGNWVKVRLPDGSVGWIASTYTSLRKPAQRASVPATPSVGGSVASVTVNVRSGPSLASSVVTVLPAGSSYRVLGWSNGWARVQLTGGATGWISGAIIGSKSSSTKTSTGSGGTHTRSLARAGRSVLTAGVRLHSSPGVKAPVIGLAAAGTRVQVLGYSRGWALVRIAGGQTGYVLSTYVGR